jgi:hypothetical protein
LNKISQVFLYGEPTVPEINIKELAFFIKNTLNLDVCIKEPIFTYAQESTAKQLASIKIFNPRKPFQMHLPTYDEVELELENMIITNTTKTKDSIIMYDGFELQKIITSLIPDDELFSDLFHIIFTNKLTCTYDYNDYRYHGRALIGSNPSIISTTGIIEAPAKSKNYYYDIMYNMRQGLNIDSIKKKYSGTYLEYHDKRLSQVSEGYILQAIFYYITGESFCDDKKCRLFNAHWQKDLIDSQLKSKKLCLKHEQILQKIYEMT